MLMPVKEIRRSQNAARPEIDQREVGVGPNLHAAFMRQTKAARHVAACALGNRREWKTPSLVALRKQQLECRLAARDTTPDLEEGGSCLHGSRGG